MKNIHFHHVNLHSGYLFEKQELNRKTTINAVLKQFTETGRIDAFRFDYREDNGTVKPHFYWDSDVAKWIEGAAYIIKKHPTPALEEKVDALVALIEKNQCEDGYFNIYHTVVAPELRWQDRSHHELYCAGHLMEAAVAYAEATGKTLLLDCMEKYADHIERVFIKEKSAAFLTPGHEEIELALLRMYTHTGKKKYLDMASYFLNTRGTVVEGETNERRTHDQSHLPVREQREARGHAVRALYLYTAMARLAAETKDAALSSACHALFEDIVRRKMYVTGGFGSTRHGEAFTGEFDLPNSAAYAETCASIAMIFFAAAMQRLDTDSIYADIIERALYNGAISGLSLDGKAFFYENPLEIDLAERKEIYRNKRIYAITQRVECFNCSCCPPNLNRLLASLGNYVYGIKDGTLFVHQFVTSTLASGRIRCRQETSYPNDGTVRITASGVDALAVRIPSWCKKFSINRPYHMENGYAVIDATEVEITFELTPQMLFSDTRVAANTGRVAIMRGPVVYCAEGNDNGENLHAFVLSDKSTFTEVLDSTFGLHTLEVTCEKRLPFENTLYSTEPPKAVPSCLKLIPYHAFANRGECNMLVWLPFK